MTGTGNRPTGFSTGDAMSPFITPIPAPKKGKGPQQALIFDEDAQRVVTDDQQYELAQTINSVRNAVDRWRALPDPVQWRVTPETARLLHHRRHHRFNDFRPFFYQVEAVETVIWLTEAALNLGNAGRRFLDHLEKSNAEANPDLARLALKLATGKTTVMAILIARQTINAVRRPNSRRFTRGFLVVTPGITIKDRLRVLQPNDPDSYYRSRELLPGDMLGDLDRAKIVITNFLAFKLRETMEVSKGGRALLQGRGPDLRSLESEGQMLQRVIPELMGMRNVLALNDEAHRSYREKVGEGDEGNLTGDDRKEAEKNREAARLWISGLEAVGRKLGLARVIDLSATRFFLRGSGYAEGTLFPWMMNDFSLMDAIKCGIVKLPRVPVTDNIPGRDMPKFCRVAEAHPRVRAYAKNHGLGLDVPYLLGGEARTYIPDFIVLVDHGRGEDDPLHLIVEIKGYRGEDAKVKKATMETYWVPGVNALGTFGPWTFAEFTDVYEIEAGFGELIDGLLSPTAGIAVTMSPVEPFAASLHG